MKPPTHDEREELQKQWADREGVKKSVSQTLGWGALVKLPFAKPPKSDLWRVQAGDDHCSLWNKDGKPYCWISQPYGLSFDDLKKMVTRAEKYGLEFRINTWPAWHYPGNVLFIEWKRASK